MSLSGHRRPARGFTLVELMIVVAIIAIIAAVAYPSYVDSIVKGKRGQGRAALLDLMQQQERYLTQKGSYAAWNLGDTTATVYGGGPPMAIPFKTYSGDNATGAAYSLYAKTCDSIDPPPALNECIVLYAAPNFSDAAAGTLSVQSTGLKSCNGTNTSVCW